MRFESTKCVKMHLDPNGEFTAAQINLQSMKLKFQTVAEKTAKNVRGLLYFAAPCRP